MLVNKHGIPGIGVTGKPGKKGKTGNSFYMGPIDQFFEFIGENNLTDSSIDYDDIDYNITYAEDEERLSHIYNEGDIIYITDPDTKEILYMLEVTEDMTTCTKKYFLERIKQLDPFKKKLENSDGQLMFPVNLVNDGSIYMYNMCKKHMKGLVRGVYFSDSADTMEPTTITEIPSLANKYEYIPPKYTLSSYMDRQDIINNGDEIHRYDGKTNITGKNLIQLEGQGIDSFSISAYKNAYISIKSNNVYIDNLYIKNGNLGNVESYNTLYAPELNLDNDGNCYTLNSDDYIQDTESFLVDTSSFFRNPLHSHDGYHFGTIHKYWNYDEQKGDTLNTHYYKPNYITGTVTENAQTNITKVKLNNEGDYVRNWDSSEYKAINDMYVKQALIYALDTSTLQDVSYLLNESVSNTIYELYKDKKGIIVTEQVPIYRTYDYIETLEGDQYRTYREAATEGNGNGFYSKDGTLLGTDPIDTYIDTSFYSNIEFTIDTSITKINLAIQDPTAQLYRHHEITQWISTPNGLKYYSKQTTADYNTQTNTFDISANWESKKTTLPGFIDVSTVGNADLFTLTFNGTVVTIDASTSGDEDIVTKIELYENSVQKGTTVNVDSTGICTFNDILTYTETVVNNANLLSLYKRQNLNVKPNHVLYTIKYAVEDETECTHIATYDRSIGGFTEYRKFPNISLRCYNDMESLEQLNNADNGILVNQFQTFVDLKIDDFTQDTWGKMQEKYPDPVLNINLDIAFSVKKPNDSSKVEGISITQDDYNITYSLIKPNIDIFTATAKELSNTDNIKQPTENNAYSFTIDEATAGIYKLRILIETKNPIPVYGIGTVSLSLKDMTVTYSNGVKDESMSTGNVTDIIAADPIKFVIAPISYIAGFMQKDNNETITNLGTSKWYGSDKLVNIVVRPYGLDQIQGTSYSVTRNTNWNALKFKRRYLQDNIQTMLVKALNINKIKDLLPETLYNTNVLAGDNDDIYNSYLQFVYNSELFNPCSMKDEYQFQYNNNSYLASEYGQLENNTAVFVTQENEINVRSLSLLNSMRVWNSEYKSYKYESDNPFKGHLETYGNGYQYLPRSADQDQDLCDSIMALSDVMNVNNEEFMNESTYFEFDCNIPAKGDDYTPSYLFRTLLYNLKWVYPKYYSENGVNLINMLPFSEASISGTVPEDTVMPYNLCYTIYPRIMFNDEEQTNIILMLRKPTVMDENKDLMDVSDLCIPNVDNIQELENPINVMN